MTTLYHRARLIATLCALGMTFLSQGGPVHAQQRNYLTTEEIVAIGVGSTVAGYAGWRINHIDSSKKPLINGLLPLDGTMERLIAGSHPKPGQSNFLDNDFGSVITPVVGTAALLFANLAWPQDEPTKDAFQDLFLYGSGLFGNKGLNDAVKGWVARPRPYVRAEAGTGVDRPHSSFTYDHNSFWSGHASSSFFVSTYVNNRLHSIMRREMSPGQYDDWKWVSSVVLYGWSSLVALSRVHSLKHHFSDVLIGAVAGILVAELYYGFGEKEPENPSGFSPAPAPPMVTFRFNF